MILTGEPLTAAKALELGIVSEVHKPEELHAKQLELAEKICKMSLYSASIAKGSVKYSYENDYSSALLYERRNFEALLNLPGSKEGINAFINKKTPDFRDK